MNQRPLLCTFASACILSALAPGLIAPAATIDRHAVVTRHNPRITTVDPEASLSVGNGDFAFTVDATGLQCFDKLHHTKGVPIYTLAAWAWHDFPNPEGHKLEDASKNYNVHGRQVPYIALEKSPAGKYFRENPHPLPLGQFSFLYQNRELTLGDLTAIDQTLDLWTGIVTSRYLLDGHTVEVVTAAHPERSMMTARIRSPLLQNGTLALRIRFPYAYDFAASKNNPPLIWNKPDAHTTKITAQSAQSAQLTRTIDAATCNVKLAWDGLADLTEAAPHDFRLAPRSAGGGQLAFTCEFTPATAEPTRPVNVTPAATLAAADKPATALPSFADITKASVTSWREFWTKGGIIDLSASTNSRAPELERRTIQSLYVVRVNYASIFPPSECGLVTPTWFGKHNSEVYFIHSAQFYQWGHTDLLEKGLSWYQQVLPLAKADAAEKGYKGACWPKMAGPDGRPTPGGINPFIIWNHPNPIYLCELVYRDAATRSPADARAALAKYKDIVLETGDYLASYAFYDTATKRYILGPPLKASSEASKEDQTQNPTFELALWYWGLHLAQQWRERLGLAPDAHWADVLAKLATPTIVEGRYIEIETEPNNRGATSQIYALGCVPQTPLIDPKIMKTTFDAIHQRNPKRWNSWAMGFGAMTATRLGDPQAAVDIVTNDAPSARFMPQGYVRRPKEPRGCPAYMPFNASFLGAVALMAAGYDTAPEGDAPGFPKNAGWTVRSEGLNKMP